jgi:hypothetical protein
MPAVSVGVDVGEDFLDLAVLQAGTSRVRYHRVALRGIEEAPIDILRERLAGCCPGAGPGWLALIDSPRWPRDLDCSTPAITGRNPTPSGRTLDRAMRRMLRASATHTTMRLSMFPTPALEYFRRCVLNPACKPHLRSIYHQLFEPAPPGVAVQSPSGQSGNFTRFMLAGFLTFRVWESLDVRTVEAYPDLQFRLCTAERLLPKRAGKAALAQRVAIIRRVRRIAGIGRSPLPAGLDQADAEILAATAMLAGGQGSLAFLEHPAEGRFLITFSV